MMSSSASSSSSPPPEVPKSRKKAKGKSLVEHSDGERNIPLRAYEPPEDYMPIDHDIDAGDFDLDTLNQDDDIELWLVRAPEEVRYFLDILMFIRNFSLKHS
jgi:hypothetical protein